MDAPAMDVPDRPASGLEARGARAGREELVERVARAVCRDGAVEAPGGLRLLRRSSPTPKDHGVSSPALCVIAQGSKEVLLGDELYRYDADRYLITGAALPTASRVTEASRGRPYLGLVLGLDPALVGSVMVEAGHPAPGEHAAVRAFDVGPLDAGLLDAVLRLLRRPPRRPASSGRSSPGRSSSGSSGGSRAAGCVRSRSWAATPTASPGPWSGSARTSTGRFGSRTSPGRSG